ncbi:hypothetical protein F4802DRAFT_609659 [Xylaria palmicola]|nr:hypothetical protein F4802DRAFT_609659 [Xylaria palmicola]
MPPLTATPLLYSLIERDTTANLSNTTHPLPVAQVVCAWPVSGQYGFGTRILYYVLVATCVLARRKEWLRNACLAAALLLPAVAAIHAVVLAAVHQSAVDLDIYGAFQICSIGILAAPITVYNSKTYFNDPGRNIIFLWTGLLLAGMLSLTVEFFRIDTHGCAFDDNGMPIDPFNLTAFPYMNASCNLNCIYGPGGPYSLIRRDSTNEPSVIPVPNRLTFSAVTLLAAASSIPPVLTLMFTWERILEINWKRRFAREENNVNEPIEGTNGATPKMITFINGAIWTFISSIQIPLFSGIVVVLLVLGEINFWSDQVSYQTEPFSSVGQWANVVATVLVILGSLFYVENEQEMNRREGKADARSTHSHNTENPREGRRAQRTGYPESTHSSTPAPNGIKNQHRKRVADWLEWVTDYVGTPKVDRYDNSVFQAGKSEFPVIPGEENRVPDLEKIRTTYRRSHQPEDGGSIIPAISRVNSLSSFHIIESGAANRHASPSRSPSRSNTTPVEPNGSHDLGRVPTSPRQRRDTLDVPNRPRPVHFHPRQSSSSSTPPQTIYFDRENSPMIVVSAEPEETSPTTPTIQHSFPGPS